MGWTIEKDPPPIFTGDIRQVLTDNVLLDLTNDELRAAGSKLGDAEMDDMREAARRRRDEADRKGG